MQRSSGVLAFALVLLAAPAGPHEVLDLPACVRRALARSPILERVHADTEGRRADVARARAGALPAGSLKVVTGPVNRAHGNPVFSPDSKDDFLSGLGFFVRTDLEVHVPLYTFGKISSGIEAAEAGLEAGRHTEAATRDEVVLSTVRLYWDVVLTRQVVLVVKDMLDAFDSAVKKASERLDQAGSSVTEADVLELRIGRAQVAAGLFQAESGAELALAALGREVGTSTVDLELADRRLGPVDFDLRSLSEYVALAERARPDLAALSSGIGAARAKVAVAEAGWFPALGLALGLGFARAPNRDEQTNPFAWDELNFLRPIVTLALAWDLDFWAVSASVDQARAELSALEARETEAKRGLALDVEHAYAEVVRWRKTVEAAEDGSRAGRALMVSAVTSFDLGLGSAEALFRGLSRYTEIHTSYLEAVHDYNVALGALQKAVGRDLMGLE